MWPLAGIALLLNSLATATGTNGAPELRWQPWSTAIFDQARRQDKLVLLDVVAAWCKACRKMDESSFRDPRVLEIIGRHYVPVRADIDHQAQIRRRYGDYGVPAVVILNAEGAEIIKRRGYLEPDWLYWLLVAVTDNPSPQAHH